MRTILVFGKTGQVGFELHRTLAPLGKIVSFDFPECDFLQPESLADIVRKIQPDAIVNAVAYTQVDKAEVDTRNAHLINAVAPGILAHEAKLLGVPFLHYSTDYVFDGSNTSPYTEDDTPAPTGAYGKTKLDGDNAVLAAGGASYIFRTSWVYGTRGVNFFLRIMQLAREREELRIVNDQIGCPTWSRLIAETTALALSQILTNGNDFAIENSGVYNLVSSGSCSWHAFATKFLELDTKKSEHICKKVTAIPSSEFPTPTKRPAYSVLSCSKLERVFGLQMPSWEDQLNLVITQS